MRTLTWKLGGALLLIVVVSVGLMAYLTNLSTAREFQQYVSRGNTMYAQSLADSLGETYTTENNWTNLQDKLESLPLSTSQRVIVTDSSGVVIGDTAGEWLNRKSADIGLSNGTSITASGQTVGSLYLLTTSETGMGRGHMGGRITPAAPVPVAADDDFLDQVNTALWQVGLITAAVAIVIGLVLTRQITRPVRALISGVRHLTRGELSYRVKVKSHDEIGELAESFNTMASGLEEASSPAGSLRRTLLMNCARLLQ